jgi:hypothetical protein
MSDSDVLTLSRPASKSPDQPEDGEVLDLSSVRDAMIGLTPRPRGPGQDRDDYEQVGDAQRDPVPADADAAEPATAQAEARQLQIVEAGADEPTDLGPSEPVDLAPVKQAMMELSPSSPAGEPSRQLRRSLPPRRMTRRLRRQLQRRPNRRRMPP